MKHLLLFIGLLSVCSCSQTTDQTIPLIIVDVAKDYPAKEICLQDIADIEYIPMATSDSALVNTVISCVCEEGIVARGGKVGEILIFDSKGQKLQGRICKKGQGPEEYNAIIFNIFDWKRKEVFIADYTSMKVYDFNGNYLRTLLKEDIMNLDICNLDDNHLLCSRNKKNSTTPYHPYYTLNKDTGEADTLSYEIPRFIASNRKVIMNDGSISNAYGLLPQLAKCNNKIWLTDVALDTVFALQPGKPAEPVMIPLQASTKNEEVPLLHFLGMNDWYAWISRIPRNVTVKMNDMMAEAVKSRTLYMYNHATQEWIKPIYRNKDFSSRDYDPKYINLTSVAYGYGLITLNAIDLVEAYQKKMIINDKLKEIASKMQEEDNPVLMLLKFKPYEKK